MSHEHALEDGEIAEVDIGVVIERRTVAALADLRSRTGQTMRKALESDGVGEGRTAALARGLIAGKVLRGTGIAIGKTAIAAAVLQSIAEQRVVAIGIRSASQRDAAEVHFLGVDGAFGPNGKHQRSARGLAAELEPVDGNLGHVKPNRSDLGPRRSDSESG